jgi:hypothetical protein
MDGYVYASWGGLGQARGYGEGFWNSNIYLKEQEKEK